MRHCLGSPEHSTDTELRQFLDLSMPQCFSNAVVLNTMPSPSPDFARHPWQEGH